MIELTRRNMIAGLGAGLMAGIASPAHALVQERYRELMRHVMSLMWVGQARVTNNQFEGGELVTAIGMKFGLHSDWSYEGAMMEMLNYGGKEYRGMYKITGECWTIGTDVGVSIYNSELMEADRLPEDFRWDRYRGDFRFYNDSSRKDHFTLQGILTSQIDGTVARVVMIDSD